MSIYKSAQTAYNPHKKKYIPVWRLDTATATVTHFDVASYTTESKTYHTDYVRYHLSFSVSYNPNRLHRLVNEGKIEQYLDDLEQRVDEAISRQVELLKQNAKEYQVAVLAGNLSKAAGLENCLVHMARESVFECMVYI